MFFPQKPSGIPREALYSHKAGASHPRIHSLRSSWLGQTEYTVSFLIYAFIGGKQCSFILKVWSSQDYKGGREKEWIRKDNCFTLSFQHEIKNPLERGEVQSRGEGIGHGKGEGRKSGSAGRKEKRKRMGKGRGIREGEYEAENYSIPGSRPLSKFLHLTLYPRGWAYKTVIRAPLFSSFH